MRLLSLMLTGCLLLATHEARAQDDPAAIVQKGIKAHGGADKLSKLNAVRTKTRGTMDLEGISVPFSSEAAAQLPSQMKNRVQVNVQGLRISAVQVLNGDRGWTTGLGATEEISNTVIDELKESLYAASVQSLAPLLGKGFALSAMKGSMLRGRPAVGIKVTATGHKDITLYFDKETGLLVKSERRSLDSNMNEVFLETYFSDFKEIDGLKAASHITMLHDGRKVMEGQVTELKFLDKIDDKEFGKP